MRRCQAFNLTGCPIRISTDLGLFASPRGFSQLITSFFASYSQGIHQSPLLSSLFLSRYSRSNTFNFRLWYLPLYLLIYSYALCQRSYLRFAEFRRQGRFHATLSYILKKQRMCIGKSLSFACFVLFFANECFCLFCPFGHSIKEVFQPHLPVRLPCYDLAPVTGFTLGRSS